MERQRLFEITLETIGILSDFIAGAIFIEIIVLLDDLVSLKLIK